MSHRHCIALAVVAIVCLLSATPVDAQSSTADPGGVDLSTIDRSLRQLVDVLRDHLARLDQDLELRRVEVAIAALDLRSKSIMQLEERLFRLQGERDEAAQRQTRLQQQTAELEDRQAETNQTTDGQARLNLGRALERLGSESELIENTLWDLDRQILDLQNRIGDERSSLDRLEELVADALDSL